MIPRRFFWLLDSLMLASAFALAYVFAPFVQPWFTPDGVFHSTWVANHLLPPSRSGPFPPARDFFWILAAVVPGTILLLEVMGGYRRIRLSLARTFVVDVLAPFLALSVVAFALFATKQGSWSRLFFFLFGGFSAALLLCLRIAIRLWHENRRKTSRFVKNIVLMGSEKNVARLAELLVSTQEVDGAKIYGWLSIEQAATGEEKLATEYLGNVKKLGDLAVHRPFHEIIIAADGAAQPFLREILETCDYFRLIVRIIPEPLLWTTLHDLRSNDSQGLSDLPAVVLKPREFDSDALFVKRLIDFVVSLVLLILLLPLFAVVALAIKLTTPKLKVFYSWRVVGKNGVEFTGYKFTTMVEDADQRKEALMPLNEMCGPVFKIKNDPRVTPLGRILRKFSINELPQLWSVLKGDMSLVGPRPAGPHELVRYELWHKRKLCVQSGVTCLWQIRGRNKISNFDDWVRMDLEYIENWSLWLDLKIFAKTAIVVVMGSGS